MAAKPLDDANNEEWEARACHPAGKDIVYQRQLGMRGTVGMIIVTAVISGAVVKGCEVWERALIEGSDVNLLDVPIVDGLNFPRGLVVFRPRE